MGASGSAWIKPRKRTGLRPEALKDVPHPRFLRPGQRFFRLRAHQGRQATFTVGRVPANADWCEARREDADARLVRLKQVRLLDASHYRFLGYAPRTYDTHVYVVAMRAAWVDVVCPEWHPSWTIAVAVNSVPEALRREGSWLACRADLAADKPGLVQPRRLGEPKPGFAPDERFHLEPAREVLARGPRQVPPYGPGCGDIVLYTDERSVTEARAGRHTLHVQGHRPPVRPGGRVYLHYGGRVQEWALAEQVRLSPTGTLLRLASDWHETGDIDAPSRVPVSAVADGAHGTQEWRWRTWSLSS